MQHLGVNFGVVWRFELFLYLGFYFSFRKSGLVFKSPVATLLPTWQRAPAAAGLRRVQCMSCNAIIYPLKSAIMCHIQTPHLVQLMNIVSNYIFDCNNRDANRAFVTYHICIDSGLFELSNDKMAMVGVDDSSLRWTCNPSWLACFEGQCCSTFNSSDEPCELS